MLRHLGEYQMWEKRTLWENSARVPLVIRAPWLKSMVGKRSQELVELVDLYRTVLDAFQLSGLGCLSLAELLRQHACELADDALEPPPPGRPHRPNIQNVQPLDSTTSAMYKDRSP